MRSIFLQEASCQCIKNSARRAAAQHDEDGIGFPASQDEKRQKEEKDGNQVGVGGMQGDAFLIPDGQTQD